MYPDPKENIGFDFGVIGVKLIFVSLGFTVLVLVFKCHWF